VWPPLGTSRRPWTWIRRTTRRSSSGYPSAVGCRPGPPPSPWPRSTRRPGSGTSTTATGRLFQQRPSQGWGSARQLRDPYYATNAFYDALIKIDGWENGDITEVAQEVQRSGYPDAYRDHEGDARILASTLTGHSAAGFVCLDRSNTPGDPAGLASSLRKTFGRVSPKTVDARVVIDARTSRLAWAYAHHAVANAKYYGVTTVKIGDQTWQTGEFDLPEWTAATPAARKTRVEITLR
jgi:hypothetical protein